MFVGNLALLVVIALVAVAVWRGVARRSVGAIGAAPEGSTLPSPPAAPGASPGAALDRLAAWEAAGLVSPGQAEAIRVHERSAPSPRLAPPSVRRRRVPAVAEALGYIGGTLAAAGLVLLLARAWDDLGTAGRLGISGAGATALTLAGVLVRERDGDGSLVRLRGFLWLLASGAVGVFTGVLVVDAAAIEGDSAVLALTAGAIALHAGALWRGRAGAPAQQVTCLGAALVTVAGVAGESGRGDVIGLALLASAAAVVVAGLARRTVRPVLTTVVGGLGAVSAEMFLADEWGGPGFVTAVVVSVVLLAVAFARVDPSEGLLPAERYALGVVGLVSVPLSVPQAIVWYAREAGVATGLLVAVGGAALVWLAAGRHVRAEHVAEAAGGLLVVGGLAIVGVQSVGLATLVGLAAAVGLVAAGTLPERSVLSIVGALGLLVNVPWAIGWFFPGEGRMPALVMVTGALIVGVAVLLSHQSGRFRRELGGGHHHGAGTA